MTEKSKPLLAPALAAEQRGVARLARGEPLSFTQAEVDMMAKGGQEARGIAERLSRETAVLRPVSDKAGPAVIEADEMAAIVKAGKLPTHLEYRLPTQQRVTDHVLRTAKAGPSFEPPGPSRGGTGK